MNLKSSLLIFFVVAIFQMQCIMHEVKITNQVDPDIILVNIGDVDRETIGTMLLKIDSCKPELIAVDALFVEEKDNLQDLKLMNAFKAVKKDILTYTLGTSMNPVRSHNKFRSLIMDEGLAEVEEVNGLSQRFIPARKINNSIHEHFALKIVKHWKPGFQCKVEANKSIPVKFTRTLDQFIHVDGEAINQDLVENVFKNKIVLVGYLGPTNEDKHFTPIRFVKDYPDKVPDTYGVVILANAIRTILKYDKSVK